MRADFQKERQSGIGSSDMPAILGISPFSSPVKVYLEKIGEAPPVPVSAPMRFGLKVEPIIAEEYEEMTDNTLNRKETFFRHPEHDWFITHPDRFVLDSKGNFSRLVELKSVGPWMMKRRDCEGGMIGEDMWGEPGTDQVPEYVIAELQHHLHIIYEKFGIEYADIAAFFRGPAETKIYTVKYDLELGQLMLDRAMKFWFEHVLKKQPPAMDGSPAATELLKRKFPRSEAIEITATPAVQMLVDKLKMAYGVLAGNKKTVEKMKQEIRFILENADTLLLANGERITCRTGAGKTKWKGIAEAIKGHVPKEIYEQALQDNVGKESRAFRVPRHWETAEE